MTVHTAPPLRRSALVWALGAAVFVLTGCHGPRPQTPPPVAVDLATVGHELFEGGDYPGALEAYQSFLAAHPEDPAADLVLYRMAMIHLMPDPAVQDWNQAQALFQRLADSFPASPLKAQAEVVLRLQAEVERLYHQLEGLKRIDLGTTPAPPPQER